MGSNNFTNMMRTSCQQRQKCCSGVKKPWSKKPITKSQPMAFAAYGSNGVQPGCVPRYCQNYPQKNGQRGSYSGCDPNLFRCARTNCEKTFNRCKYKFQMQEPLEFQLSRQEALGVFDQAGPFQPQCCCPPQAPRPCQTEVPVRYITNCCPFQYPNCYQDPVRQRYSYAQPSDSTGFASQPYGQPYPSPYSGYTGVQTFIDEASEIPTNVSYLDAPSPDEANLEQIFQDPSDATQQSAQDVEETDIVPSYPPPTRSQNLSQFPPPQWQPPPPEWQPDPSPKQCQQPCSQPCYPSCNCPPSYVQPVQQCCCLTQAYRWQPPAPICGCPQEPDPSSYSQESDPCCCDRCVNSKFSLCDPSSLFKCPSNYSECLCPMNYAGENNSCTQCPKTLATTKLPSCNEEDNLERMLKMATNLYLMVAQNQQSPPCCRSKQGFQQDSSYFDFQMAQQGCSESCDLNNNENCCTCKKKEPPQTYSIPSQILLMMPPLKGKSKSIVECGQCGAKFKKSCGKKRSSCDPEDMDIYLIRKKCPKY